MRTLRHTQFLFLVLCLVVCVGCGGGGSTAPVDPGPTLESSRIVVTLTPNAILASGAESFKNAPIPSLLTVAIDTSGGLIVTAVSIDLTTIGGAASHSLYDNATGGDQAAGDGLWTTRISSLLSTPALLSLPVRVDVSDGRYGIVNLSTALVLWEREEILYATAAAQRSADITINSTGTILIAYQTANSELGLFTLEEGASSWENETIDPFVASGAYPSIAVDEDDHPIVAYRHESQNEFRAARETGSGWPRLTTDLLLQSPPGGEAGRVAINNSNQAVFAWWANDEVLVAREATGFTTEAVELFGAPGAGSIGLAMSPSGAFCVAYTRVDLARVSARIWNGSWGSIETIDTFAPATGVSATAGADGRFYVCYTLLNTTSNNLVRLATRSSTGSWSRSDVLSEDSHAGVSAVALDNAGIPHILVAHGRQTSPVSSVYALYHAVPSDHGWSWLRVQDTAQAPSRIGLTFDRQGRPHACFQDGLGTYRIIHGTWQ